MNHADYRAKCLSQKINACWHCGETDKLVVHHIDGDRNNNELGNLIPLCKSCHTKIHKSKNLSGPLKRLREKLPDNSIHTDIEYSRAEPTGCDGVNQVWDDGRYKLPPDLGDKYRGDFLSAKEIRDGRIVLERVEQNHDE